jgi:putative peptidoglycan binding protein
MKLTRTLLRVLCLTLALAIAGADVIASPKSRSSRGSRSKSSRGKSTRETAKKSKRDKRGRERASVRGKRGRRLANSRRGRRRGSYPQAVSEPGLTRPAAGISSERATEIQNALIKAGYLDAPASGQYDDTTIDAMKQYQSANRLPVTGLPSAAVLKKLGVSKRSNDGYAVPVNSVSESEKKRSPQ